MEEIALKETMEDIGRFVDVELGDLPKERRQNIVTKSAGLFVYAATVSRYRFEKLEKTNFRLAQTARQNYSLTHSTKLISDVFGNPGQEVETSKRVLLGLAPLVFDADDEVDEIAALARAGETATSYFRDRTLDCLRILDESLRFNICNLPSSFSSRRGCQDWGDRTTTEIGPELHYACHHWAAHLASLESALLDGSDALAQVRLPPCNTPGSLLGVAVAGSKCGVKRVHGRQPETLDFIPPGPGLAIHATSLYCTSLGYPPSNARASPAEDVNERRGPQPVCLCGVSPDGACVVSGSADETVRIWDAMTGAELTTMEGHSDSVNSLAFSPDGARVVSGSADETVRIWDAMTGAELTKMEGHSDVVRSVAFSPDGTRVASSSDDQAVRIWDAKTGTGLTMMEGHSDFVRSVAFSPDGTRVASSSDDQAVRIWDAKRAQA
ncbi:WD40-repeat-containing domain protein [Mycena leptocephala]|nr:WD40-repeat-containing domain protein [Mycena leptocephala]